jgi:hypothetical protein
MPLCACARTLPDPLERKWGVVRVSLVRGLLRASAVAETQERGHRQTPGVPPVCPTERRGAANERRNRGRVASQASFSFGDEPGDGGRRRCFRRFREFGGGG